MSEAHRKHSAAFRVYYEDTDAAGIVYHANYLRFAERARTEMLRAWGFDHPTLKERFGVHFAVRRCRIEFRSPARLDDMLTVESEVLGVHGARLELMQRIRTEAAAVADIAITLALVDLRLRPVRVLRVLPAELLAAVPPGPRQS